MKNFTFLLFCFFLHILSASAQEPDTLITHIQPGWPGSEWKFSFVHITDVHIGDGVKSDDYGTYSFFDNTDPSDAGLPLSNLRNVMHWINLHAAEEKIKFVLITGDLTESGERSELYRFREVMDSLCVPYIPMLGNHDTWPNALLFESDYPCGDSLFIDVFSGCNANNQLLLNGWDNGIRLTHTWNPDFSCASYFQDFRFKMGSYQFICTDFNSREPVSGAYPGSMPFANIANFPGGSWPWLKAQLTGLEGDKNTFLFTHYPLSQKLSAIASCYKNADYDTITRFAVNFRNQLGAWFSGHLHNDTAYAIEPLSGPPAVCTQYETSACSETSGGHFRIVHVWDTVNVNAVPTEPSVSIPLSVFPNPVNQLINIKCLHNAEFLTGFRCSDMTGQILTDIKITGQTRHFTTGLPNEIKGVLLLEIQTNRGQYHKKITKL